MIQVKTFQVRDDGTHIAVMATFVFTDDSDNDRDLRRSGYAPGNAYVILTNLDTLETQYDPYRWNDRRTMPEAHKYIRINWESLRQAQVIDVEFILGERTTSKEPE